MYLNKIIWFVEFPACLVEKVAERNALLAKFLAGVETPEPVTKNWVPKNPEIPLLERYI